MRVGARLAAGGFTIAALLVSGTGCSSAGDLSISNDGPADVTVSTGDEELTVSPDGGAAILDYGCTPGDVTVTFASGQEIVLPGPVCPEQQIAIGDGTAELQPA